MRRSVLSLGFGGDRLLWILVYFTIQLPVLYLAAKIGLLCPEECGRPEGPLLYNCEVSISKKCERQQNVHICIDLWLHKHTCQRRKRRQF